MCCCEPVGPHGADIEQQEAEIAEQVEAADEAEVRHAVYRSVRDAWTRSSICAECHQPITAPEEASLVIGRGLVHTESCFISAMQPVMDLVKRRGLRGLRALGARRIV
jgi:hypothetical protein